MTITRYHLFAFSLLVGLCIGQATTAHAFEPYMAVPPGIWATGLRLDNGLYSDDAAISDTRNGTRVSATIRARHTITGVFGIGLPVISVVHNASPGGVVWSFAGESYLEQGSDETSWVIAGELSVINHDRERGYQPLCTTWNAGSAECWPWNGQVSTALRLTAGEGSAFGCLYNLNCFNAQTALEIFPNGARWHSGIVFGAGATIDRDIRTSSTAEIAYELSGQHRIGLDLSHGQFAEAAVKLPPPGSTRALCVDPQGRVFVGKGKTC